MRYLIISDVQAAEGSARCFHDPTLPLQRYRVQKLFDWLPGIYEQEKCDGLFDLGDLTDDRSSIPIPTIDVLLKGLDKIPDGMHYKLIGNHEQFMKANVCHAGKLTSSRFRVVSTMRAKEIDDGVLVFASFFQDPVEFSEKIKSLFKKHKGKRIFFFGHFSVIGAHMKSGLSMEGVPIELLDPAEFGFLGHIHKHQKLRQGLYYVGSPFQQDFGECDEEKFVGVLDTAKPGIKWISVPGFPVYRNVDLPLFLKDFDPGSEDRYRVRLHSPEEMDAFYAHPYASRAEPVYDYAAEPVPISDPDLSVKPDEVRYAFPSLLKRFVESKPPEGFDFKKGELEKMVDEILHNDPD